MHIAEGFLHGTRAVVTEVREHPESTLLLGAGGAFPFVPSAITLPPVTGSSSHPTGTITAHGLVAGYKRARRVLDGASLTIPAGRRPAVLGANGSGRTTLLRCLSGALKPSAGAVAADDVPLERSRRGLCAHRQEVQLVLQDPDDQVFPASVTQYGSFGPLDLGLPEDEVRERVAEALRLLAVDGLADRPTHQLSYGERKRVALAGAVAMRLCVLLLRARLAALPDRPGVIA